MKTKHDFNIYEVQSGFSRVVYTTKNAKNEKIYYCFQEDGPKKISFYRCSRDGEPEYEIGNYNVSAFESPKGDTEIEKMLFIFLQKRSI